MLANSPDTCIRCGVYIPDGTRRVFHPDVARYRNVSATMVLCAQCHEMYQNHLKPDDRTRITDKALRLVKERINAMPTDSACFFCGKPIAPGDRKFLMDLHDVTHLICDECYDSLKDEDLKRKLTEDHPKRHETCYLCGADLVDEWPMFDVDGTDIKVPMCWDCTDTATVGSMQLKREAVIDILKEKLRQDGRL